ncbi:MAG: hypothetical protein UY94_C0003G0011 [Parcubacteria group bacterium GW2011_GWA2_56_21]|nr:MAG: hypothetical protein UY94_C0003G0011 [Parcubacteria group bacterium GW2011_GWA2_56_21]
MRVSLFVAGVLGAIFFPPWVPLVCMGALALRFRAWEVIILGMLVDFLWLPSGAFFGTLPLFTIAGLILAWGLEPLRSEFLLRR